ncbi:hypothetical protein ACO1O0_009333 [Amphichorda felina]
MPAPSDTYTINIPSSPPPPTDLSSYSRFMHDHTKRQMEAQGAFSEHKSSSSARKGIASGSSSMTNGTSPSDFHT